jgi:predicted PurR-regulated permease PerM
VLIVLGLAAFAFVIWKLREALLLTFAAVLVSVLLLAAVRPIERRTGLAHGWALAIVGLAILAALVLFGWRLGAQMQFQLSDLFGRLPRPGSSFWNGSAFPLPPTRRSVREAAALVRGRMMASSGRSPRWPRGWPVSSSITATGSSR